MKTINLLILIVLIIIPVTFGIMYIIPNPIPHSILKIHEMKDSYTVGEKYSFYYTLEGFGRTCHSATVSYPNYDGKIIGWGVDRDCNIEIQNKEFFYDSREYEFHHNSLVPQIPGIYKVSVHIENIQPVIFEFRVFPENKQPLVINVTRGVPNVVILDNSIEKIFTEDGPLQICKIQEDGDKNCGSPVLDEENCVRYTVWLNEFQKEKLSRIEDFPRYPPWGNQIFPLVTYCESVGEFYHVLIEDLTTEIIWSFVSDEQNKDKVIRGFEYMTDKLLNIQEQEDYCESKNAFRIGPNACQYYD